MKKPFLFTDAEVDAIYDFLIIAREVAETSDEKERLSLIIKNIDKQTNYSLVSMNDSNLTIQTTAAVERLQEALAGKTEEDFDVIVDKIQSLVDIIKKIKAITNELNH
jgi:methyl-accepting chemotaxis protein